MKSTTVALLLANLLLLAGGVGLFFYLSETAEDDSEIEIEPTGEEIATWTVFYSVSNSGLPTCNSDSMGWLYYVGDDQNFRVCTASGWEVIDLTGPQGPPGVPGADGMHGIHGIDGVHGTNGQDGVNGTNGTNGTDGADGVDGLDAQEEGKSALVKVSTESIGNHCEFGGLRVQVGVDDNRNGVLDGNEVDQTEFVCNGAPGSGGNPPPPNVPQGRVTDINFGALDSFNSYGGYLYNYSSGNSVLQGTYQSGANLYFKASDSVLGIELWAYNISSGNVWMVYDANNGSASSGQMHLYDWNENQALVLDSTVLKWYLFDHVNSTLTEFQHNGCLGNSTSHQGDPVLTSALGMYGGVIFEDKLYSTHRDGRLGYQGMELWEFDLINGTCTLIEDIRGGTWMPSSFSPDYILPLDSFPSDYFVKNDWVCFHARTGPYETTESNYWCHDPANGSTWKLIDTYSAGTDEPSTIKMIGDTLYFKSINGGGNNDWGVFAYDFSNQTSWLLNDHLNCSHFDYHGFEVIDSEIYWRSNENYTNASLTGSSSYDNMQLWKLDLNNGACMQVSNYTGGSGVNGIYSGLYGAYYPMVGGTSIFFQMDDNIAGSELWRFETSNNSLWRITDVWAGGHSYDSNPVPIRTIGDTLYFRAYDGQTGIELWAYGMNNGTVWQVIDINRGGPLDSSEPGKVIFVELGTSICFDADDGTHGVELWCI